MTQKPEKKYALILGANSDIARAIGHRFAKEGYHLQLAARKAKRLDADVNDLSIRHGIQATAHEFDATDYESHAAFYQGLSPKPDVVFCVFGYLGDQETAQTNWDMAHEILTTNFNGAASILHQVANEMETRGSGTIVGISSVAGERGRGSNYYYGSAKAGFTAYLAGMRNRLAKKGVHIVTVKPGFVDTAMTEGLDLPPLLTAKPEQVANDVYKAVRKQKNVTYTKWMWRWVMFIIKSIPEGIFKKLSL